MTHDEDRTAVDFGAIASQIVKTRTDFGRLFDEVGSASPAARPFKVVSLGVVADNVAFERALRIAEEGGWFHALGERLIADEFLPRESKGATNLQAVISEALGFPDASVVERGGLRARARLCRVEVEVNGIPNAITGTGFLVGPSTVLTSFHVVSALLDPAAMRPAVGSERFLTVTFDHASDRRKSVSYRVPPEWFVCGREPHPAEVTIDAGAGVKLAADFSPAALAGYLDYAVIVVAGSPGAERGFYDLGKAVAPESGSAVHLFQHPMGVQQRHTSGIVTGFRAGTGEERIDHTANSLQGSSGGLLVDGNYLLIGLHQGSYGTSPVVNTAISAVAIREHVVASRADLLDSRYAQAYRLADGSRPILGRPQCQDWIRRGTRPVVRAKPALIGRGDTFTSKIMAACLPPGEHLIGSVSAFDLRADAGETVKMLLERLGVPFADLPTVADVNSSRGVWIAELVETFVSRIGKTHPTRTVWIVMDDLQKSETPVPEGSVAEFLSALYLRSAGLTNLRIVLLGLRNFPSGFPHAFAQDEDILPPRVEDIASYVRSQLTANGIDYSASEIDRISKLIMRSGGDDITALSDYVSEKVDPVLSDAGEAP